MADLIKTKNRPLAKKQAFFMGLMQGVAILPGISRSGSTMAVGMMTGVEKQNACEFSFLMSIPIIIGSAVWELIGIFNSNIEFNPIALLVAFVSSFVFGILSIKTMLKVVKNNKLMVFVVYILIISLFMLFWFYIK